MSNKTEVITQKTKTMKVESRDTENIRDKTQNEDKQTEVTTQKAKAMKEESRETGNIRHKTPNNVK
jgi:hypothetical protein